MVFLYVVWLFLYACNSAIAFDTMSNCLMSPENYGLLYVDPSSISSCTVMRARVRCLDDTHCSKNSDLYRNEVRHYERVCGDGVLQTIQEFDDFCGSSIDKPAMSSFTVIILSIVLPIIALLIIGLVVWYFWTQDLFCFAKRKYDQNTERLDLIPQNPYVANAPVVDESMVYPPYPSQFMPMAPQQPVYFQEYRP